MTVQEKAKAALAARDAKDFRWLQLIFRLVLLTELPPTEVERQIEGLSLIHI